MELVDFILALNDSSYREIVRHYNNAKIFLHVQDTAQKRSICKKINEFFSNPENIRTFLRNNFTSELEAYFENLILSNPLNTLVRIDNTDELKKSESFFKFGFLFKIKKDYFAIPDEIFKNFFEYFNKNKSSNTVQQVKEYLATLPAAEFSYKMSRAYFDPHTYFIKALYLLTARELTGGEKAGLLFEDTVKDVRGRAPLLDTLRKFTDFIPLIYDIKKQKETVGNLFHKADIFISENWLEKNIADFIKENIDLSKSENQNNLLKKLKADVYFNIKSLNCNISEIDSILKLLLCVGAAELIYMDLQPVYIKLSAFGDKIFNILFNKTVNSPLVTNYEAQQLMIQSETDFENSNNIDKTDGGSSAQNLNTNNEEINNITDGNQSSCNIDAPADTAAGAIPNASSEAAEKITMNIQQKKAAAPAKKKMHKRFAFMTPDFHLNTEVTDFLNFIKIICFADIIQAGPLLQFTISKESVLRSIKLGMNYSDFKNYIQRNVKGEPPANVTASVMEWYYSVVVASSKKCVFISFSGAPEKLAELDKDKNLAELVLFKLKNNQYIIEDDKIEQVFKYFSDRSIPLIITK
ncbi:MAG: hypothetical protein QMC67_09290 [Candidatus Wallbacteria bacterium]